MLKSEALDILNRAELKRITALAKAQQAIIDEAKRRMGLLSLPEGVREARVIIDINTLGTTVYAKCLDITDYHYNEFAEGFDIELIPCTLQPVGGDNTL